MPASNFFDFNARSAAELDEQDVLAAFRHEFVIDDPELIYLDGNSLGRLPKRTATFMHDAINKGWGNRLIRVWNDGWIQTPSDIGAKIAKLVGAQAEEILVTDGTSANLFKLAVAALRAQPGRSKIVSDECNFPSDLYTLQGVVDLLGRKHTLELIRSDNSITIDPAAVSAAIDTDTALVSLSHVTFKSAFMYDMAAITAEAHKAGALMLWDLCHSVGSVPINLNAANADLAIGCTYKYLNGGPGSPAFLYVRRDLQKQLQQPMWGWLGSKRPFSFELDYTPADSINRYLVGTPPMLSMKAIEPSLDIFLEAGMERLREKSVRQTEYLIALAEEWLAPLGFTIGSPRQASDRGSHVSLRHPEGYRLSQALIDAKVIPDFREPDNIRLGIAPLYTTFSEIYEALFRLKNITKEHLYEKYSPQRAIVT